MSKILLQILNSISFTFRLIILFLVFFLLSAKHHKAQIVIKEKVSLTPQNKLKNFPQVQDHSDWWTCSPPPRVDDYYNPIQVVWQDSWYPLNPGRPYNRRIHTMLTQVNIILSELYPAKSTSIFREIIGTELHG